MISKYNYGAELFQDKSRAVAYMRDRQREDLKAQNDELHRLLNDKEQEIKELEKENRELRQKINKAELKVSDTPKEKKIRWASILSNALFYLILVCMVLGVFLLAGEDAGPRNIFGYSYFTVLTSSMQDEIPRGSLVITHKTDPDSLRIGDTITYMKDADTTITHKIVGVYENYDGEGVRGFQTQGVNNAQPDKDIVNASNVVGKVIFSLPQMGAVLSVLRDNVFYSLFIVGLLLLLSFSLQIFFRSRKEEKGMKAPANDT